MSKIIEDYLCTKRKPLRGNALDMLKEKPKLFQPKSLVTRVTAKVLDFLESYISGISMIGKEEE